MGSVITLAFDSFKGSIGAPALGAAVEQYLGPVLPGADLVNFPCSDGGDGFAESVGYHFRGGRVECTVSDPLMRPRTAHYIWSPADRLAIIESAQANGLDLLNDDERDPLRTTTVGVGELLLDAARRGAERIVVGVGGSATVDGGTGMAQALGFVFEDGAGRRLGPHIGEFGDVSRLVVPPEHPLAGADVCVACDVRTRLLGPRAASAIWIYGPQKGGTEDSLSRIDTHLRRLDPVVRSTLGVDYGAMEMGGAAGGLAAGLAAFAGAALRMGMELFDELTGLRAQVARSALVITGEGRLDAQSSEGKVVSYVSELAREASVPVIALCGSVDRGAVGSCSDTDSADPAGCYAGGPEAGRLDARHGIALDGVVALADSGLPAERCIARPLDALDAVLPHLVEAARACGLRQ